MGSPVVVLGFRVLGFRVPQLLPFDVPMFRCHAPWESSRAV